MIIKSVLQFFKWELCIYYKKETLELVLKYVDCILWRQELSKKISEWNSKLHLMVRYIQSLLGIKKKLCLKMIIT